MKIFSWDQNIGVLEGYAAIWDFVWENYTNEQLRNDIRTNRQKFVSIPGCERAAPLYDDEIRDEWPNSLLAKELARPGNTWVNATEAKLNLTIAKTLEKIYTPHHILFSMHPKKKIIDVIAQQTPKHWHTEKIDFMPYKKLTDFIKANCTGREILFANYYGNSVEPYFSQENSEEIYARWPKELDKFSHPEKVTPDNVWLEANWYAHECAQAVCYEQAPKILKDPTRRLANARPPAERNQNSRPS